ncbi:MAG: ASPIC/UnbV domain-containing protein, partial [Myxococcota bacterium]
GRGWLAVSLDQPGPNRFGIGATVTASTGGGDGQVRPITANPAFTSGRPPVAWFGLGDAPVSPVEVVVRWPDGGVTTVPDAGGGAVVVRRDVSR